MLRREASFFRGSELTRLLVLIAVMVVGMAIFWQFGRMRPVPAAPMMVVEDHPKPVVPDRSIEFESVTDRSPMLLRDMAAYARLLDRARSLTPTDLAGESRRDVMMTHLWERPERYRGVPVHIEGDARRVLRYESKLSKTGWLYEAWIMTPEAGKYPYVCVFEDPPKGFPIGPNVGERVVFNGYFLKIMRYEAGDVARGAPVLVGRIGWNPGQSGGGAPGSGSLLQWTLILLGCMIVVSFLRWIATLARSLRRKNPSNRGVERLEEIDPVSLDEWVRSAGSDEEERAADEAEAPLGVSSDAMAPADGGTRASDESQSTSLPPNDD